MRPPRSERPESDEARRSSDGEDPEELRPWVPPELEELPPLTELTLQTGDPIEGGGDTGGGGSTVF